VIVRATIPDTRDRPRPGVIPPGVGRAATRLYDALHLLLTGPLQAPSARTALVILTDGVDTASRFADAETARRRLGESHVPAYVIHYDTSQDHAPAPLDGGISLSVNGAPPDLTRRLVPEDAGDPRPAHVRAAGFLRQITDVSGGRLHAASTPDDLRKTFADIATELSQQYTLAYYPANQARDGSYRRIRVEVDMPDARVRARAGYYQAAAAASRRH
jgi:VWFA-related protein